MRHIPKPLIEKIAHQKYKERLKEGLEGNADKDWEEASEYLINRPLLVRLWVIKQNFKKLINSTFRYIRNCFSFLLFPLILPIRIWIFTNNESFWSNFSDQENRSFNLEIIKLILSMLGLFATISAGVGLILTYVDNLEDRRLAQERLITDRFSKAIELLGNKDDISVRVGAIFALERIAKDSPKDHWTIMEILTSYIRKYSSQQSSSNVEKNPEEIPIDIQVAITVIGRRDVKKDNDKRLNLQNVYLIKTNLSDANLSVADLSDANLSDANLSSADLSVADLSDANLSSANLISANLISANLSSANLISANLNGADLRGANLSGANLSGANLSDANLSDANLSDANLSDADLNGANLNGANLSGANLIGVNLIRANLSDTIINNKQIKTACNWRKAIYTKAEYSLSENQWIPENKEANNQKIQEIEQDKSSNPVNPPQCKN